MKRYGQELLDSLKSSLVRSKESIDKRESKIYNNEMEISDCFVSRFTDGVSDELLRTKVNILENGGTSDFERLFDLNDNEVDARVINGRFGSSWLLSDEAEALYGVRFVGYAKKQSTYKSKGFYTKVIQKAAWATIKGSGKGMSSLHTVHVIVFPSNFNYLTGESI
jgi:hypothetical protein